MSKIVIFNLRQSTQNIGGAEVVIRRTVAALDKSRFEVVVVCLKKPGMDLSAVADLLKNAGATYLEIESKALIDLHTMRQVLALIRRYRPHIVHCHDPKTDFIGFLLRLLKPRLPLVTTLHGWVVTSKRGAIYKCLDQFFARFFHQVIAVSPLIEQEARQSGVERVQLIENGIPTDEWSVQLQQSNPLVAKPANALLVGFLGRICREKGPIEFIETAALIAAKNEQAYFVVAGEGPLLQEMKQTARLRGIASKCHFLGQLPWQSVPAFISSLYLLLSTSETEGIPNALLEAAVSGVPIVASSVGGVPRIVVHEETGFLAPYAARAELAAYAIKLLDNPELHQEMGFRASARIKQQFSIKATVDRLTNLYLQLADRNNLPT